MVSISTLRLVLIGLVAGGVAGILLAGFEHASSSRRLLLPAGPETRVQLEAALPLPEATHLPSKIIDSSDADLSRRGRPEVHVDSAASAADIPAIPKADPSSITSTQLTTSDPDANEGVSKEPLPRVCGSPAVDGYAHVDPKCLQRSPTNQLWQRTHAPGAKSGEGLACNVEYEVSLDGLAVGWGIGNTKKTPEECCQACRDHVPGPHVGGPFSLLPCNVWVFCNAPTCFEADAHTHTQGDCWLKFSEAPQSPEVNARGAFSEEQRRRHPTAPERCQWVSGVLLPLGQTLTNGTWGPRAAW